jgi:acetyltransferase-like isoleucine patch superfamily enzyme
MNYQRASLANVVFGESVIMGRNCILGALSEATLTNRADFERKKNDVSIDSNVVIANHVVIGEGSHIGAHSIIDDFCRIGHTCSLGENCRVMYAAFIGDSVKIGHTSRIGGFVCDGTFISHNCSVMGRLVHTYTSPDLGWWDVDEPSPKIMEYSVIASEAVVIGGITVGPFSYVASNATVSKNVPPWHVATEVNHFIPANEWKGEGLRRMFEHLRKNL